MGRKHRKSRWGRKIHWHQYDPSIPADRVRMKKLGIPVPPHPNQNLTKPALDWGAVETAAEIEHYKLDQELDDLLRRDE